MNLMMYVLHDGRGSLWQTLGSALSETWRRALGTRTAHYHMNMNITRPLTDVIQKMLVYIDGTYSSIESDHPHPSCLECASPTVQWMGGPGQREKVLVGYETGADRG